MPITIRRQGDSYVAEVTPPHGGGVPWISPSSMSRDSLIESLQELGCHVTDIGDAFYEADPEWQFREQDE